MTSEKLAWHRENDRLLDPKFDRLAVIGDKRKEKEGNRKLSIKYNTSTIDDEKIYLEFTIETPSIKSSTATIFVEELNSDNEIAVPKTIVTDLKSNSKQSIKVSFDKTKKFDRYIWQDGFVYQATITIDGLSAKTDEFKLKIANEEMIKSICERDLTVDEVKNIVKLLRENTYYEAISPKTKKKEKFPLTNLPYYSINKIFHRNDQCGKYKEEVMSNNSFENFTAQLNKTFNKYEINNCQRRCHFLSQIFIETQYFTQTIETDNGYTSGYDPLRGRGFIHITLTDNYIKYTQYKKNTDKIDIDFKENYSLISTNMEYSADASGWYWKYGSVKGNINPIADKGSVKDVTPYVNAASLKLKERENAFEILKRIFK